MNIPALLAQLEEHEGFVASAYVDSEGWLTIGCGRLIDKRKGGGITREEALFLLENDVRKVTNQLNARLPWWRNLSDVRQRVVASMCFNLGMDGLLLFKNTLHSIRESRWADAADGMLASKWATQVGKRAQTLARMMREDKD